MIIRRQIMETLYNINSTTSDPLYTGAGEDTQFLGLSTVPLIILIFVSASLLLGIPLVYLVATDNARVKVSARTAHDNDKESNWMHSTNLEVSLPDHNNAEVWANALMMKEIREEVLQVAKVPTDFQEPQTKIRMVDIETKKYMPPADFEWLARGVDKCQKWNIEMDPSRLSHTSDWSLENALKPERFDVEAWKQRLANRDWVKVTPAKPPATPKYLPQKPTDDDVSKIGQLDEEIAAIEERQRSGKTQIISMTA